MRHPRIQALALGAAQDGGVPQAGCGCANCLAAGAAGLTHTPASLAISVLTPQGETLRAIIDAGPELRSQLRRFPGRVDAVLLTHLHMGHYAGLLEFGREVLGRRGLEVWCSHSVADVLLANSPWRELWTQGHVVYRRFAFGEPFSPLPGLLTLAYPVPHRNELGDTACFVLRPATGEGGGLLYLPDADGWGSMRPSLPELVESVDTAMLDATFFDRAELGRVTGRALREVPHPPVCETLGLLASHGLAGRVVLIHMNHTNPLWDPRSEQRRQVEAQGARVAAAGLTYAISREDAH
jgi:pyrroloquinoline quinone biosynthesis protein B